MGFGHGRGKIIKNNDICFVTMIGWHITYFVGSKNVNIVMCISVIPAGLGSFKLINRPMKGMVE